VRVEVLFACDLEREKRAAVEVGYEHGVEVASTVRGIAVHLESVAASPEGSHPRTDTGRGRRHPYGPLTRASFTPNRRVRAWLAPAGYTPQAEHRGEKPVLASALPVGFYLESVEKLGI
jgi:hypothetical protein